MGNEITTTADPAMACSMLASNPNTRAVLDRAFDCTATFTASEIALAEQIAAIVPVERPADDDYVRRSIGSLAGALPAAATSNEGGRLKLKTYQAMLVGSDERALAYACRRCLDELDWMPTVHQIKERMAAWVNPDEAARAKARAILRSGRRAIEGPGAEPVGAEDVRALRERAQDAASVMARPPVAAVAFSERPQLEPGKLRIPNKGDYERLFGIDPEAERRKAEQAQAAAEEADADLLRAAVGLHVSLYRAA